MGVYEGYDSKGAYHGALGPYDANFEGYPNLPYIDMPPEAWPGSSTNGNITFEMMLYFDELIVLTDIGKTIVNTECIGPEPDLQEPHGHFETEYWSWFSQVPLYAEGSSLGDLYWQWEHGEVNEVTGDYW
ncbi:unnamed protein product, partial [marine sediment metagenome]